MKLEPGGGDKNKKESIKIASYGLKITPHKSATCNFYTKIKNRRYNMSLIELYKCCYTDFPLTSSLYVKLS